MAVSPPRPPTPERLHRRALHYLERFATTGAHLRRVLLRRALRDAAALGLDAEQVARDVEAVVARLAAAGLLDDALFAATRARRLVASGRSPARIRAALAGKGLAAPAIEAALTRVAEEQPDPELAAAIAYARKRRLGPWGPAEGRPERAGRELAALARAGFGYRTAQLVVAAADAEALEVLLAGST
ncbi:MAG: RecX family transcriptional regulator [Geminicoccaceae bacterium]